VHCSSLRPRFFGSPLWLPSPPKSSGPLHFLNSPRLTVFKRALLVSRKVAREMSSMESLFSEGGPQSLDLPSTVIFFRLGPDFHGSPVVPLFDAQIVPQRIKLASCSPRPNPPASSFSALFLPGSENVQEPNLSSLCMAIETLPVAVYWRVIRRHLKPPLRTVIYLLSLRALSVYRPTLLNKVTSYGSLSSPSTFSPFRVCWRRYPFNVTH